jgi:hypothetical protein
MITVKRLKELLNQIPEDAKLYAYEGEDSGILIYKEDRMKPRIKGKNFWWIGCGHADDKETYTEGFNKCD